MIRSGRREGNDMLASDKNKRSAQLMLFACVALVALFWLGVLWFAIYRTHWFGMHG